MGYVERVEANLAGLDAVSVGTCPGCDECRGNYGDEYRVEFDDDADRFTFPAADGAEWPTEAEAEAAAREAFADAWRSGKAECEDPGGFSSGGCGVCGSPLGGDRFTWHALGDGGRLLHFDDACTDCVLYLANGDVPERD